MPQRPANRVPELAALLLRRRVLHLTQLLQQLALLRRQLGRRPDMDADMQIAMAALAEARQAFGAQAVRHTGLRSRLDPQRRLAKRRGHLHLRAQCGLREGDAEVVDEVVAVTLEARIFLDVEHRDEIAARPVPRARDALPSQREVVVIGDAGGHVDLNRLLGFDAPVAATAVARAVDDGALTRARGTGRDGEELPEQRLRVMPHFAAAAAGAASHRLRAGLGPSPRAFGAGFEALDADRLGRAAGDFSERELQPDLDVVPAPPNAPMTAAKQTFKTSNPPTTLPATCQTKISHEDHERFGEVEVHRAEAAGTTRPRVTKAVIGRALLRIS